MPPSLVQSLADKSGEPIERVERLWNKAKGLVAKEYDISKDDDKFYALVTGILKKMLKITEESEASTTTASAGLTAGGSGSHEKYMGLVRRHECKCKDKDKCTCKKKKKNESFFDKLDRYL